MKDQTFWTTLVVFLITAVVFFNFGYRVGILPPQTMNVHITWEHGQ